MSGTRLIKALPLAFCLLASLPLFAQKHDSLPYYIEWEPIAGAGGYDLEVTTAAGKQAHRERLDAETTNVELDLPEGKYRFRISTLNKFLTVDSTSDWVPFTVLGYGPPTIAKISHATIAPGSAAQLSVQIDMLSSKATAALIAPSGKAIPLSIKKAKNRTFALSGPALTERGEYALSLVNPPNYETIKKEALRVAYPEPTIAASEPAKVLRDDLEATEETGSAPMTLRVKGKNFSPEAAISLRPADGGEPIPLAATAQSATEIALALPPTLEIETYAIALKNAPELPEVPAGTLIVERKTPPKAVTETKREEPPANEDPKEKKEKAPNDKRIKNWVTVGAAGGLGLVAGDWRDIYDEPVLALSAFADLSLSPSLVPESGRGLSYSVGLRADFTGMHNDGDGIYVESDTQAISVCVTPAATYAYGRFRFRLRVGGGVSFLKVKAKPIGSASSEEKSSVDAAATTGLAVEFLPLERLAIGLDNGFLYVANQDPLTRYAATFSVSYAMPIRR